MCVLLLLAKPAKNIFALAHVNKSSRNTTDILATRHPPARSAGVAAANAAGWLQGSINIGRRLAKYSTHSLIALHTSRDLPRMTWFKRIKGPFNYYVTLFLPILTPLPLVTKCHTCPNPPFPLPPT